MIFCRVVIHGAQMVLLVAVLVSEVIIQQHQLLQRSSFGGSAAAAAAAMANGDHKYQPLANGDADMEQGGHGRSSSRPKASSRAHRLW